MSDDFEEGANSISEAAYEPAYSGLGRQVVLVQVVLVQVVLVQVVLVQVVLV